MDPGERISFVNSQYRDLYVRLIVRDNLNKQCKPRD